MTNATFKNTTTDRVYWFISNGRTDFGYLDPTNSVSSGNANEITGITTIQTFKKEEFANARDLWVTALDSLPGDLRVTLQDILGQFGIDSIEEI